MQSDQIMLALCGLCIIAVGFGNLKGSTSLFVIYRRIVAELDDETRKKYQKSIFAPYTILGLCVGAFSFALPYIRETGNTKIPAAVMITVFVGSFIWVLVCNKKYLGRFTAPRFGKKF